MKAIVTNINKESVYAHLNGHTFDVIEVLNSSICLSIPSPTLGKNVGVDFSFKEVFIVDLENEFKVANPDLALKLHKYCELKCIK